MAIHVVRKGSIYRTEVVLKTKTKLDIYIDIDIDIDLFMFMWSTVGTILGRKI